MTLGVSLPQQAYKGGFNENPAQYGSTQIAASSSKSTVDCGVLGPDDVIRVLQTATSASTPGGIFEVKYDNSLPTRYTGNQGQFVVSYAGGQQNFTFTPSAAPSGGTFTITFDGETTTSLAYNASAATILAALIALTNIGTGGVTVAGTMATTVVVTFRAHMMRVDVPAPTCTSSLTNPGAVTVDVTDTTTNATNAISFDWLVTKF